MPAVICPLGQRPFTRQKRWVPRASRAPVQLLPRSNSRQLQQSAAVRQRASSTCSSKCMGYWEHTADRCVKDNDQPMQSYVYFHQGCQELVQCLLAGQKHLLHLGNLSTKQPALHLQGSIMHGAVNRIPSITGKKQGRAFTYPWQPTGLNG